MSISKRKLFKWRKEALLEKSKIPEPTAIVKYNLTLQILELTQELIDIQLLKEGEKGENHQDTKVNI